MMTCSTSTDRVPNWKFHFKSIQLFQIVLKNHILFSVNLDYSVSNWIYIPCLYLDYKFFYKYY